jgi:hypothetical protein
MNDSGQGHDVHDKSVSREQKHSRHASDKRQSGEFAGRIPPSRKVFADARASGSLMNLGLVSWLSDTKIFAMFVVRLLLGLLMEGVARRH